MSPQDHDDDQETRMDLVTKPPTILLADFTALQAQSEALKAALTRTQSHLQQIVTHGSDSFDADSPWRVFASPLVQQVIREISAVLASVSERKDGK